MGIVIRLVETKRHGRDSLDVVVPTPIIHMVVLVDITDDDAGAFNHAPVRGDIETGYVGSDLRKRGTNTVDSGRLVG